MSGRRDRKRERDAMASAFARKMREAQAPKQAPAPDTVRVAVPEHDKHTQEDAAAVARVRNPGARYGAEEK